MEKTKTTGGILKEFKTLKPFFYKYRFRYIAGFICLFVIDAAQLFIPQFTKRAVNLISQGEFIWLNIFKLCLAMIAAMAVISFGRFLWRLFIHGSSRRIESELRQKLFDHLLTLSWDFFQKNKIGDLITRSTSDLSAVRMAIGWGLVAGLDGTVMALSIIIIIFLEDAGTAVFAVLPLPFITLLIIFFGRAVGRRFKRAQEANSALSETVQETFAGIRVVKSFVKESWFIKRFAENNDDYRDANMSVVRLHGFFMPLISFLAGFTSLIVLFAGGRRVVLGLMTAGDMVALFSYINMLIWPMLGAGFTVNIVQRGAVSLVRINEILNTEPSIKNSQKNPQKNLHIEFDNEAERVTTEAQAFGPENIIEIKNLSFSYGGGKDVLRNISLTVKKGATLGLLGRTGAGKSTLVKLLPRMLDPPPETVFVKGRDIRRWNIEALRSIFGVSPQDSFVFSDSIKNNIVYGMNDADGGLIETICGISALDRDIESFSSGKETLIGERGLTLSGGQKQRLSIARAMIIDSEILILDDSLSAVDAETEKRIVKNIYEARKGKTTIIISHRVSAFANADYAAVLDGGVISEYGTPSELIESGGYYAKTAALQRLYE
ncbi:MAG: ABC transporter ATP-binding protein/permease [Spirochaetaceae bacterium]|jgi:ATP-binding cassette subfamily B protein|nr:ABC transporter ATP-binding protein/permease [Spirochaetaceae bacterium]